LPRETLERQVLALRLQTDTSLWQGPIGAFDRALAYNLYQSLLAPVDAVIKDKKHLFIVPTGPLTSLPFSVLVTDPPTGGTKLDADPAALRQTAWLIKRQALTTLPSVSSLRALRVYADKRSGNEAFAGFGDPIFDNAAQEKRLRHISRFFRGDQTNLQLLRTLPRLRETGEEVRAMARLLGAPDSDVYLRERATEAQIKTRDFSRKRIIEIATHGLLAGDLAYAEPGLAFSPPGAATDLDDGYLASSEAARLNLHADLVILSACDTAAGEVPGANGLSGLARAFILAGAKSLLVSHWAVDDRAAMLLTTRTVEGIQKNPALGRAEALRQAMLSVMNEPGDPMMAHPVAWAPFVLVGEPRIN
jgi:CHAT domain-containing protein